MRDRHPSWAAHRCPLSLPIFLSRASSLVNNCSAGLQRASDKRANAEPIAWLRTLRTLAHVIAVIAPFACQITASTILVSNAYAQPMSRSNTIDRFAKFIEEASSRFAVPAQWIRAVMQVESAGDELAISPRGAMGPMQLMLGTWVELSARYGLGLNPFDPRDNIMAGAAYLKEMHDRFGSAGFLAAYHSGPARYDQHLATGRPLPKATTAYVAAVTPLLGNKLIEYAASRTKRAVPWREAPLFVERTEAR